MTKGQLLFALTAFFLSVICVGIKTWSTPQDSMVVAGVETNTVSTFGSFNQEDQQDDEPKFPPAEELLREWEKPEFALFISGRLHGYIEPCGCVGLDRQKGGLLRRHTAQGIVKALGWNVVSIDTGNQIRRFSQQALEKLRTAYQGICGTMQYDAVGLGPDDITKAPSENLAQIIVDNRDNDDQIICANVVVLDEFVNQPYRIVQSGEKKIGVTSIIGDEHLEAIKDNAITKSSVADALKKIGPQLQGFKCDLLVCTVHASPEECVALAKAFPIFDLLVCAGGPGDPKDRPDRIVVGEHVTQIIFTGKKGMHIGVVGFYGDRGNLKYERVPLDARFIDSEEIKVHFKKYQSTLKQLYVAGQLRDINPRPHPSGNTFLGSESCRDCHQEEFNIWQNQNGGPHTQATIDLAQNPNDDRVWVQRDYDPEFLSCHVTGWNPQKYYPYESGFLNHEQDVNLTTSGCENCHGPGSAHVRDQDLVAAGQLNEKDAAVKKSNRGVRITKAKAKREHCMQCHDLDNSPDFLEEDGFETYWEQIKHGGG